MRTLFVTSEIYPYVKTGGLGDVCAALPVTLRNKGTDIRLFVPGYPEIMKNLRHAESLRVLHYSGADDLQLLKGTLTNGMVAYVLASDKFFNRPTPYVDHTGKDWPDNHLRFGAFSHAAANLYLYEKFWKPDVVHINDWQCGLVPAYMRQHNRPRPSTVMTIHNLGYQGLFPSHTFNDLALPAETFATEGLEYYGQVGFMKAGLFYSDHLTTVSPTYAQEIQTPEFGCGLDGLLRVRANDLTGILNGIDTEVWNPATDPYLENRYDASSLELKKKNKRQLLRELGLPVTNNPVFTVISRLTSQKGFDMLLKVAPSLLAQKAYLILHGTGDKDLEDQFKSLERAYPKQVVAQVGYDEATAHRFQSGADSIIVPSRFEPCGLVQMYGLRYGTVPIVRKTGGLADSVTDVRTRSLVRKGTGFLFDEPCPYSLEKTISRAIKSFWTPAVWKKIQTNAMEQELGWEAAGDKYLSVYRNN